MTQGKDKPGASNRNESMASFLNERTNAYFQDITTDLDLMLPVKTSESEAEADMIETKTNMKKYGLDTSCWEKNLS